MKESLTDIYSSIKSTASLDYIRLVGIKAEI